MVKFKQATKLCACTSTIGQKKFGFITVLEIFTEHTFFKLYHFVQKWISNFPMTVFNL